ncbi:protein of unknown function [Pseudorhizobium banfieldiae]|uniref:Uncharacterized protein n=1 Tax=Pseudorhizobium banfieldiae TaxID=1125847 RepID=L0NDZ9_9HYPH|nr:hypothetical protein [Pseudorhizobium banfieldiae]CAD6605974.1 hypothetical protein RNT25_01757 [arsenite-oxidising bacterium NT-25]CCF19104.1 protein of unknown function [Pseudorhizobium banfieldiae]
MHDSIGKTYRDKITGFQGVATGHVDYITGCNQTLLQPKSADPAKRAEAEWFDDQRLEEVPNVNRIILNNGQTPGFDREAPKR